MNDTQPASEKKPWSRPAPSRTGPRRNAGGFYRTADRTDAPTGVPLTSANAAVVAAVRLAYEVAEAQIDRSTRLARRLRDAADGQVGKGSDAKALDAAERLVQKTLLSGLEWWESSVAEGRCPVKRLAAAEYQMIGSLLGFGPAQAATKADPGPASQAAASEPLRERKPAGPVRRLLVVHKGEKKDRRPVGVEAWNVATAGALQTPVFFYSTHDVGGDPIAAELEVPAGNADLRLVIATPRLAASGRWKCVVCDDADVQVGSIEISL